MRNRIGIFVSIVLSFLLAGTLIQNYRSQHETDRQLNELKKQLASQQPSSAAAAAPRPAGAPGANAPAPATPLIIGDQNGLPTDYARKQQQIEQVMTEGWKLINERSPVAAQNAADLFQAALVKIDPQSPDLYNGLGRSLLIAGKPREAITAWRRGLELAPKMSDMQSGIGWAYWQLHDPFHAKQAWDAAVGINPKSPDAWSALAWVDLALGDSDHAKAGFQALVDHDTSNKSWVLGLSMAQARNTNLDEIQKFFKLPPLVSFTTPVADPVAAATTSSATTNSATTAAARLPL